MAIKTKEELKLLFEQGDKPTGQDFQDLLDSFVDQTQVAESAGPQTWQPPSSPVFMSQGQELTLTHPSITNETYSISVSQEVPGESGKTNISIDFSPGAEGNYIQEDNTKIEFVNGVVKLEPEYSTTLSIPARNNPNTFAVSGGSVTQNVDALGWAVAGAQPSIRWQYPVPTRLSKIEIKTDTYDYHTSIIYIQGSNDNSTWTNIGSFTVNWSQNGSLIRTGTIPEINQMPVRYYRLLFNTGSNYGSASYIRTYEPYTYDTAKLYYVTTSDNSHFALAQASKIQSVLIANSIPTNTAIKCLVSFDGRNTWNYYNGAAWVPCQLSDMNSLGSTPVQIQNGFINLVPVGTAIDFAFGLQTTNGSVTPSVDLVTITYQENSHYEMATIGNYTSSSDFGLKRVDPTTTIIKRINAVGGKAFITMTI